MPDKLRYRLNVKNKGHPYDKLFTHESNARFYVRENLVDKPHAFLLAALYLDGVYIGWFDSNGEFTETENYFTP
jgi:hypothetical protein